MGLLQKEADAESFSTHLTSPEGRRYDRETADAVDAFRKQKGLSPPADGAGQPRGLVDADFVAALSSPVAPLAQEPTNG